MSMFIVLEPLKSRVAGAVRERRCSVTRVGPRGVENSVELWFEFDKAIEPPPDDDCDAYLLAVIMDAMKENRNVTIKGSVSQELLSNLVEYQAAWNKWLPDIYSRIEVVCDDIRQTSKKAAGAILAFSGGVDATFSVWRHSQARWGHRSQAIKLCSLVHGFDIPLDDDAAFQNARNTAQRTLSDLGIPLYPVKTNCKKISKVSWGHSFACLLVAVLSNLKKAGGTCLVGSSEPYDSLVIPWGSSPLTDHLLSSGDFFVMHDGASHNRTEKVKEISAWKTGVENLRVCWEGDLKDKNCGVCEKCMRTKLNFLAAGCSIPSCLPGAGIIKDLDAIRLTNDAVRAEWRQIHRYAMANGVRGAWVKKLPAVINRKTAIERVFPPGSELREIAKKWKKRLGPNGRNTTPGAK